MLSLTLETNFTLFASATVDDDDQMVTDSTVSASHFSINNRDAFRLAALEEALVSATIQTHSYDISAAEFKAAEKKVKKGKKIKHPNTD